MEINCRFSTIIVLFLLSLSASATSQVFLSADLHPHHAPLKTIEIHCCPLITHTREELEQQLIEAGIQIVHYGNMTTLIVPTDDFFIFNTHQLKKSEAATLDDITQFVRSYRDIIIHIAAFTDNIGFNKQLIRLSQYRAQTMRSFLWANGIDEHRLTAIGYGEKYDVATNNTIDGSAMNRRLEIQWRAP